MHKETFTFLGAVNKEIFVYRWRRVGAGALRAAIQISHGMAENAERYERFAQVLTDAGYIVYANDHLGHGLTAGTPELVGLTPKNGFSKMTETMAILTDIIAERHPGLPIYLFGHSMGSFLSQQYMYRYPGKLSGVVLSGSNGRQSQTIRAGIVLAELVASLKGDDHRSPLLMAMSFGSYNKKFQPNRSESDWLSRDEAEVDRYIQDPFCGGVFSAGFFKDFFHGLVDIHRPHKMERIPKHLPVFILSGDRDPVGGMGKGILQLVNMYSRLGMEEVSYKLYPGGRHEMLNETNREEVMQDVVSWLNDQTS
ncbi:alpha/beta fold hydrolase [Paenibacillus sp. LMG 31456]|uniref:Alpha/beta fold hydrolase n=1 Tax=Paenibacillus foliorum TaxID=2654974 RepID=A0A972JY93_9BACL|nr:alpha/beta hydrolase [Paenibacillus foliorum]NOU92316.1 alpha/beta fold hydrolase [Paenibacillus foliorum]